MKSKPEVLEKSIAVVVANGRRLVDDARLLFDWDRYSTSLALAVLAQEEFAKGFLLQLVFDEALPWLPEVRRSIERHQCKQLLGFVMQWLPPFDINLMLDRDAKWRARHEERMAWLQRKLDRVRQGILMPASDDPEPSEPIMSYPKDVIDALNIYRHELIECLAGRTAWKDDEWARGMARKVADGSIDRKKQSALYVGITKTGAVGMEPEKIIQEDAAREIEKAERLAAMPDSYSDEYRDLKKTLAHLFAGCRDNDA